MYARVAFQSVEVGEIADVTQQHHRHVNLAHFCSRRLALQRHRILLLYVDVGEYRHHSQHRYAAQLLQHPAPIFKQPQIASELIDYYAFHQGAILRREQHQRAVDAGENPAAVYVAHQDDVGPGMASHGDVHQVAVAQVYLRQAPGPLHNYRVEAPAKPVIGVKHRLPQLLATLLAEIVVGVAVADGFAIHHHLRGVVALGLEQQRIHVGVRFQSRGLCLHRLRPANLQPVRRGKRVERHVLRLERGGGVAVLFEYTAQGRGKHAFAHVAAGAGKHHWVESLLLG